MNGNKLPVYPPPDKRLQPGMKLVSPKTIKNKWSGTLPDKFIAILTGQVSRTKLSDWVYGLCAFHTRHTKSGYINQAAEWILSEFENIGYPNVAFHEYSREGYDLRNVVCTKSGTGNTGEIIIVCGHYDCRMHELENSTARAPGADDNASGIAALLECARILYNVDTEDDILFVAFSGEEQGEWGSSAYSGYIQDNNINLKRLINLDQIGFPPFDKAIVVEQDTGSIIANNQPSQEFAAVMAQMAADYTDLPVQMGDVWGSDYVPFEERGYVVVGAWDKNQNASYHSTNDTPETLDYEYLQNVTKMILAAVLWETLSVIDESDSSINLFIRDNATDTGVQPSSSPHWKSPDLWIRNLGPDAQNENPDEGHQAPINDQPNYMYVRVHNRGTQTATDYKVKAYRCNPATGLIWPDHFEEIGEIISPHAIDPNGSARIGPFIWTPHIEGHECLMAIVSHENDHPITDIYRGRFDHSLLVRYDNNIGQRNVAPAHSVPGGKTKACIMVSGDTMSTTNSIELDASGFPTDTTFNIRVPRKFLQPQTSLGNLLKVNENSTWAYLRMKGGATGSLADFAMGASEYGTITIEIDFSYNAIHKHVYSLCASQLRNGSVSGRYTVEITAIKETNEFIYGNPRSMEMHTIECPFWASISQKNKVPFSRVSNGISRGYNGCAFCMPEFDTD